jgi:hypothetical protein
LVLRVALRVALRFRVPEAPAVLRILLAELVRELARLLMAAERLPPDRVERPAYDRPDEARPEDRPEKERVATWPPPPRKPPAA